MRVIQELRQDIQKDNILLNEKLEALGENKIDYHEEMTETLKSVHKVLKDRVLQLENKIKANQDQKRQHSVILHGIEDGDTELQEEHCPTLRRDASTCVAAIQ